MRTIIKNIIPALLLILIGCQDDMERYVLDKPADTMHLSVSSDNIVLDQDKKEEVALIFTWSKATDRGEGTVLTYFFKMDIANNNFETSIDRIEIPAGTNSISFTHKELNNLLAKWKVEKGKEVTLAAEIIAEVSESKVYMKPEVSVVEFAITGFETEPRDLFIVGTAIEGMDATKALKMEEVIPELHYTWSGMMQVGTFKFIRNQTNLYPSFSMGANVSKLVYNEIESASEVLFQILQTGFYTISLNVEALTIELVYPTTEYTDIWMVGGATPAGWNIMSSVKLEKHPENQIAFVWEGTLVPGELKFPLELDESWNIPFIMPVVDQTGISGDNRMEHVQAGGHDYKWRITDAGDYKITLNMYEMTIKFEKLSPDIPSDVPYKAVWMVGDATPGGWNTPFSIFFTYDHSAPKGTFVWEGELTKGQLKFPLSNTQGFECDYLMPKNTDANDLAPLSESAVEFIAFIGMGEQPDKKWKVEAAEAGQYKISLNVISMTVNFEKQ